jgi:DNA helicase II / ATP-dependent DNA helicase PcrA
LPTKKLSPRPISPNEEQQAVINFQEGYAAVYAGPGSGKSFAIVQRYCRLISEGVSPDSVLSLSFTHTASTNLQKRVESQVGKLSISRTGAGAMTFHSLALNFAQEERNEFGFELADNPLCLEPAANKFAGDAARRHELDYRTLRSAVSLWKRRRISPSQAVRDAEHKLDAKQLKLALAYKEYQKKLTDAGVLDFDGLLYHAVEILDRKPDVRARWKRDWLQIDEAQDLSKIEWDLVKLLSGTSVLAVGDISQGIYGFRGSDSRLFANMADIFPGTKTLFLSANFRSSPEIVAFIRPIAATQALASKFHTQNPSGPEVSIRGFTSSVAEAAWVVDQIKAANG